MNLRASPEKSCASTPTTTTPSPRKLRQASSSRGASLLHGAHHEAQKLTTTTFPRSDASESFPAPSRRERSKWGASGRLPCSSSAATPLSWWTTFQTSSTSRPTTTATDAACRPRFRPTGTPELCRDDVDRRADVDVVEEPLGLRDVHPDAAVRRRVAERGRVGRPVDPDARRREPHPARAERVARARRDRLRPLRPRRVGRVPPRVLPLDDDLEAAERRRVDRLARRDDERAPRLHAPVEEEPVRAPADDDHRP